MRNAGIWMIVAALTMPGAASAQRLPFNEAGVTMGHWHLTSKNVEAD